MDAGGKDSLSDVLVLDKIELGEKGATNIFVNVAKGSKKDIKTTSNGILLVKALGEVNGDAFKLANDSFVYGMYEYSLVGITDEGDQNGFYLQNGTEPTKKPENEFQPENPINEFPVGDGSLPLTPLEPSKPGDGSLPLIPLEPSKPGDGSLPLTPLEPSKPGDGSLPLTPLEPSKPGDGSLPLTPLEPSKPGDGSLPLTPLEPSKPGDGSEDETETIPLVPLKPSKPGNKPQGIQYSPNVGAYLGMQYAAAHMFDQNILDRRDNVRKPDETVWGRVEYSETKGDHFNDSQSLKVKTTLIQLGWDLFQNEEKTSVFGVFAGYGNSDIKNRSILTGTEAKGNVKGYQIGAYYSWMKQEEVGTYVDVWGHFAKYRNKFEGKTQNYQTTGYNGHGFSISAEIGHGFVVDTSDNGNTQWVLEPHAQVTYNYLKNKGVTDATGTEFTGNKAKGFDTRLGARFYGYREGNDALRPYVELNWLHNGTSNSVHVNNDKVSSRIGRNVGELKIGFQGHVSKDVSISAHIGFQKGKDSYKRTEAQVVFNYNF